MTEKKTRSSSLINITIRFNYLIFIMMFSFYMSNNTSGSTFSHKNTIDDGEKNETTDISNFYKTDATQDGLQLSSISLYTVAEHPINNIIEKKIQMIPDISSNKILVGYNKSLLIGYKGIDIYENEQKIVSKSKENSLKNKIKCEYLGQLYYCIQAQIYLYMNRFEYFAEGSSEQQQKQQNKQKKFDIYLIIDKRWKYKDIGILGLAPNSPWWSNKYLSNQLQTPQQEEEKMKINNQTLYFERFYYENEKKAENYKKIKSDAPDLIISTKNPKYKLNMINTTQQQKLNKVFYHLCTNNNIFLNNEYGGSKSWTCRGNVSQKLIGRQPHIVEEICFVNTFNELIFVKNPKLSKKQIRHEICGAHKKSDICQKSHSNLDKMTSIELSFTFSNKNNEKRENLVYEFFGKDVINFTDNNNNLDLGGDNIDIGDLNNLINLGLCPKSSTLAVGKNFLKDNEINFSVNSVKGSSTIYIQKDTDIMIGTGVWVLLAIGLFFSTLLILISGYFMIQSCIRRGRKSVSYYYIEVDQIIE